ncbi:putative IQ motif, EF-hand binding, WW domain, EF-hand domain pair, mitochondrial Rho GTPase [Plasmopara halstedii]
MLGTNNNHDEDHRWSRTTPPSSLSPSHLFSSTKTKNAVYRRRRISPQDISHNEPWLFQSINTRPLVVLPPSLPSLSLPKGNTPLFYLDLDSLKSLLPQSDGRHHLKSSKKLHNNSFGDNGPSSRDHFASSTTLATSNTDHLSSKKHRDRNRRQKVGFVSMQKVRRKGLRLDSAIVRPSTQELLDSDIGDHFSPTTKNVRKKVKVKKKLYSKGTHRFNTRRRKGRFSTLNCDSDGQIISELPVTLSEDLDDEKRQKEMIAMHLNLSLEEYEHLDAAFGSNAQPSLASEDEGSLTDRFYDEFQEFDVDNSGSISPVELRQLLLASGEDMDDAELTSVIQQADTDHDGEINFQEFIAFMRARKRLLQVANQIGNTNSGPLSSNTTAANSGPEMATSIGHQLPPLKLALRHTKRHRPHQNRALVAARSTPSCLRPGSKVDLSDLRRELALSELGIQELNSKVREGLHWVQQHCPVRSIKAQIFCHRWGMEKMHQLFVRLHSQQLSRGFRKWHAFLMFERNKVKANKFLKCKGSQKMTTIMNRWRRKVTRQKFACWKTMCIIDAYNEQDSAAIEIQRVVRGSFACVLRHQLKQEVAILHLQAFVRGHLARSLVSQMRRSMIENEAACLLQRCYRGYSGKVLARALFKAQRETLAACRIQRTFRNFQQRELLRVIQLIKIKNESAIVIQCCIRGHLARRERRRRIAYRKQRRSAQLLQMYVKGFLARCHVRNIRKQICAALTIQCFFRVCQSRRRVHSLRAERRFQERQICKYTAAIQIQTRGRCYITRRYYLLDKQWREVTLKLKDYQRLISAVTIQSHYRGYVARRCAQHARSERLKMLHLILVNRSALKIQAFWRGYHGRLAYHLRLQARISQRHKENEAAKRIQVAARGKLARKERFRLEQERRRLALQQVDAVLRIQKVLRGKQARKSVQALRQQHRENARLALERLILETKTRAAIKIQSCARRYLARCQYFLIKERHKQLEKLRIKQKHGAIVIQCAYRCAVARYLLLQRRREFDQRVSMMAFEKAQKEIEKLRKDQEEDIGKRKTQLLAHANSASNEAARLRNELAQRRELDDSRPKEVAQELARLPSETLMPQREIDACSELTQQRLSEKTDPGKQAQQDRETASHTQKNEVATSNFSTMLVTQREDVRQEAEHIKQDALEIQKGRAQMKMQGVCLKYVAKKRIEKLQKIQLTAQTSMRGEEQPLRLRAEQQSESALAKKKHAMDTEARVREQEMKELEVQMRERERKEKEQIALINTSTRKIQKCARRFLARKRVKDIQHRINKRREDRAKSMQETIKAAEAKEADAIFDANDSELKASEDLDETKADEWIEYWDENAQASYFYNIRTQEASWTRPSSTLSANAKDNDMEATERDTREQNAVAEYTNDVTSSEDANGSRNADSTAKSYEDEYGYYDQHGQYPYYEQNNGAFFNTAARGQMQPNYAAEAAANYAYQTIAALAYGQAMMYGTPVMGFGHSSMAHQYSQAPVLGQPTEIANVGEAVPSDPWEKFYDQYTGAAYYYNNITGEQYWA